MTNTEDRPAPSMPKEQFELLVDLAGKLMDEARACASGGRGVVRLSCSVARWSISACDGRLFGGRSPRGGSLADHPKLGRPTSWSLTTLIAVARKAGWVETTLPLNSWAANPQKPSREVLEMRSTSYVSFETHLRIRVVMSENFPGWTQQMSGSCVRRTRLPRGSWARCSKGFRRCGIARTAGDT